MMKRNIEYVSSRNLLETKMLLKVFVSFILVVTVVYFLVSNPGISDLTHKPNFQNSWDSFSYDVGAFFIYLFTGMLLSAPVYAIFKLIDYICDAVDSKFR